jgi:pilus assembly protein CpaC
MAISGQEGSFLAGGKIFIPVAQDNNKVTLEEKEFGVGLRFTPTVLAGGRINLRVAPEVSELSREGVGISAAGFSGGAILPLITRRRAATTVELMDGQSFAIGGLIKNNQVSNIHGLPVLGEVPVLGALFRSTDFQHDRTELLFVVTAHLVKPLPPNYALPTDGVSTPGRAGLFLGGRMEGKPPAPSAPATAARADSN